MIKTFNSNSFLRYIIFGRFFKVWSRHWTLFDVFRGISNFSIDYNIFNNTGYLKYMFLFEWRHLKSTIRVKSCFLYPLPLLSISSHFPSPLAFHLISLMYLWKLMGPGSNRWDPAKRKNWWDPARWKLNCGPPSNHFIPLKKNFAGLQLPIMSLVHLLPADQHWCRHENRY